MRNLAIAEAALALAKDRVPGHRSSKPRGRLLLLGGVVAAAGAAALLKRDKVTAMLPSRSETPTYTPPAPGPSNYDAPGPVANTATPVPAPDPQQPDAIDETKEEAAAGAEARAIGGEPATYAGPEGEPATEAERPLAEAGEGESEGEEQAEADLEANAEFRDDAPSDAERQIEDTIEAAGQPSSGETPETTRESPPAESTDAADESKAGGDDSDDWRTWSGRSVQP